ncbi:MAG: helix-turn-helix domain-containing protein [Methanosarcina sp.]|jgi:putative transposase|nr:helix-turn-helix domain-containing protein [Methanosarcina sp.]MDD3873475.1 helix-turn-helix domain-containing protein [Methanosarcina sp.]MDD4521610.1 helix-turn-helix domain-containing protein [Methanosarcina sp.]
MHLTKQVRIYPTEEQVDLLWKRSEKCRLIYNFTLAERKDAWKTRKTKIKYVDQANKLTELKKKYPEYEIVYSNLSLTEAYI